MKKTLFVLLSIFIAGTSLLAQNVNIEKSVAFDEPEYGWNKLLQLKNGNTFYFHASKKDGIEVTVYNSQRKQIASKSIESKLWDDSKMRLSKICGLYEINGEPVIFLMQGDGRVPTLYRMRLNGANAAVVKEDELGSLPKVNLFAGYAEKFGHVEDGNIIVEKDPQSDCYAVIYFNSFAHESNERIKVIHYDGTHKAISTAFYESPNGAFKYLSYIGSVVDGNKRVYVATYGHNGKSDDELSRVIVSKLNAGETSFTHKLLDFSEDFKETKSVMSFDRKNNRIQLMTLSLTKKKGGFGGKVTSYYLSLISYLDPESLALYAVKPLVGQLVNEYGVKNIDKDYEYSGVPQQMVINKDNTTTVLSESMRTETTYHNGVAVSQKTFLGSIGISELNDTGAEIRGYAISKKQQAEGEFPQLYISERSKGVFTYPHTHSFTSMNTNQFMSFDYVNAPNGRYVIFNDLPGNFEKTEEQAKRKTVAYVSATNTVCYKLNNGTMDKFYLFGNPDEKGNSTFSYIQSSDYNTDVNTYATMIVEKDGRDKQAKIAWITFK